MKAFLISSMALLAVLATVAYSASGYHLLKKIPVPGDGAQDYVSVDSVNRRVYVSHYRQMEVLDADSYAIVGKILPPEVDPSNKSTSMPVHGVAVAPELDRGFTSNGRTSSMTIFDLKTLKTLGVVKVGDSPDGIMYDPASRRAFSFSHHTLGATAVDGPDGKVAGFIDLGGAPEAATADGKGSAYVNIEDKDVVVKFDTRKLAVQERWPVAPCKEPGSMAIDPTNQRLFIGCHNRMMAVMNAENGNIITTVPFDGSSDAAAFDPEQRLVFFSLGEGTLAVIQQESPDKYSALDNVKTEEGARTMGLDLKKHRLFLSTAERGAPQAPRLGGHRPQRPPVPGTFRVLVVGRE